jgi:hypothetical protein
VDTEAIRPGVKCLAWLVAKQRRSILGQSTRGNKWRSAHHDIERPFQFIARKRAKQIARSNGDPILQTKSRDVLSREIGCRRHEIARPDLASRVVEGNGARQVSRTAAHIHETQRSTGTLPVKVNHDPQTSPSNSLGHWTGKYHSASHHEREPHEFLFAQDVGGRRAVQAHPYQRVCSWPLLFGG